MRAFVIFILAGLVAFAASPAFCQQVASSGADNRMFSDSGLPDAPEPQEPVGTKAKNPKTTEDKANREVPRSKQQPKRILRVMPNYPAVSAGAIPPPPTPREAFTIATQESLDYSVRVRRPDFDARRRPGCASGAGKGNPGFWGYYWRGFLDRTDGNYWVIFALPTVFHQDERYFAKGEGPKWKRALYSSTRVLITPNYSGHNSFNASELLGRGIAQGIAISYYPSTDHSPADIAEKWAYAIMRDAATNTFREFWPDIATHVLHQHAATQ